MTIWSIEEVKPKSFVTVDDLICRCIRFSCSKTATYSFSCKDMHTSRDYDEYLTSLRKNWSSDLVRNKPFQAFEIRWIFVCTIDGKL
jgi:hypothetical protein